MRKTITIFLLFIVTTACNDSKKLNTEIHVSSLTWAIQKSMVSCCSPEYWADSDTDISPKTTWRFISATPKGNNLEIAGGYTITTINPTNTRLKVTMSEGFFYDNTSIPIQTIKLNHKFVLNPKEKRTLSGPFKITVANLEIANSITSFSFGASFLGTIREKID